MRIVHFHSTQKSQVRDKRCEECAGGFFSVGLTGGFFFVGLTG
jgi:hypothetical protein